MARNFPTPYKINTLIIKLLNVFLSYKINTIRPNKDIVHTHYTLFGLIISINKIRRICVLEIKDIYYLYLLILVSPYANGIL